MAAAVSIGFAHPYAALSINFVTSLGGFNWAPCQGTVMCWEWPGVDESKEVKYSLQHNAPLY